VGLPGNFKGKTMNNTQFALGADELVRRVGLAVTEKWGTIPPFTQDEILERACEVEPGPPGVDVRQEIQSYLERDLPAELPVE
jgi:hypothetical protein